MGWADIDLTEEGKREARKAADILVDSGTDVDEVFCSYLKRSIKSAWILTAEMDQVTWAGGTLIAGRRSQVVVRTIFGALVLQSFFFPVGTIQVVPVGKLFFCLNATPVNVDRFRLATTRPSWFGTLFF